MAEYIDRNRLIKKFCNHCYFDVGEKNCAEDCYDMKIIKSLPTEDVQPVKHGRWKLKRETLGRGPLYVEIGVWKCTACKCVTPVDVDRYNYCPNCGAKMDGEDNG